MKKRRTKKSKKAKKKMDWSPILITALMDLIVGTLLIILDRMIN